MIFEQKLSKIQLKYILVRDIDDLSVRLNKF